MKKKKKKARSKVKYPALDQKYMPRTRKEYLDIDYAHKLNDEEKAWLNKFMDESLNASFKNDERDIIKDVNKKRKIYNENNARNRCIYSIAKAQGRVLDIDASLVEDVLSYDIEDTLIEEIDQLDDFYGKKKD